MTNRSAIVIKNGALITGRRIIYGGSVLIEGRTISVAGRPKLPGGAFVIDAAGNYVAPGFIDTHIHGDPSAVLADEIQRGTTSVVISVSCAPLTEIYHKIDRVKEFMRTDPQGQSVIGARIEGPYINELKAGAQDRRYIHRPDPSELKRILARCRPSLRMMTMAPELDRADPLIRLLTDKGIIASIGHSHATRAEARIGIGSGIRHATHVFNAMSSGEGSEAGAVEAVLSDRRVTAEVILDLVHVPRERFRLLVRLKGVEKTVLVSDSVKACRQAGVKEARGACRFANGKLAGSSISMIDAVRNAVNVCGVGLCDAVRMATANPAKLLGVEGQKGAIEPGRDADIVIFDRFFSVKTVIVRGKMVFQNRSLSGQCAE